MVWTIWFVCSGIPSAGLCFSVSLGLSCLWLLEVLWGSLSILCQGKTMTMYVVCQSSLHHLPCTAPLPVIVSWPNAESGGASFVLGAVLLLSTISLLWLGFLWQTSHLGADGWGVCPSSLIEFEVPIHTWYSRATGWKQLFFSTILQIKKKHACTNSIFSLKMETSQAKTKTEPQEKHLELLKDILLLEY